MNKFDAFEKLKEYSKKLSTVSYNEIYDLMENGIKQIPITLAKIGKGEHIDRVRQNKGKNLFNHINQLGYIKDKNVIDNVLTSFGRANCPHQVMFYGALRTSQIDKQRFTAIAETSHIFRNQGTNCIDGEYYTVSRWEANNEFFVVEIVFSEYALNNNPDIVRSFEKQKSFFLNQNLAEGEVNFYIDFLKFISEEFSKKVSNSNSYDYKICAAYTNLVMLHPDVSGIIYPSVQTEYFGVNIVLPPETVDKYLKPIVCSTQIVYKKGQKSFIANGEHYCKEIDVNVELKWQEHDKSILTSKQQVIAHLET